MAKYIQRFGKKPRRMKPFNSRLRASQNARRGRSGTARLDTNSPFARRKIISATALPNNVILRYPNGQVRRVSYRANARRG